MSLIATVREWWNQWMKFWFAPADPTTLGVIRIATGLAMLYSLGVYSIDLSAFFGPKGFYDLATVDRERHEVPLFTTPLNTWEDAPRTIRLPDPPHRRQAVMAYIRSLADCPPNEREQKLRYLITLQNQPYPDNSLAGLDFVLNYMPADPQVRKARLQAVANEAVRSEIDAGKIPDFIKQMPTKGDNGREVLATDIDTFYFSLPKDREPRDYVLNYLMEIGAGYRGMFLDFLRTLPEDEKQRNERIEYLSYWNVDKRAVGGTGKPIFSIWFHVTSHTGMVITHIVVLGIFVLFTLGLFTRVTSVLAWITAVGYIHRTQYVQFGMDTMSNILLLYLMIGNSGGALSLDRVRERYRAVRHSLKKTGTITDACQQFLQGPTPTVATGLALRLLQIHFCIIYAASGLSKLKGQGWWTHTAFWDIVANPEFTLLNYHWYEWALQQVASSRPLYAICAAGMVAFTFIAELLLPVLVWTRARPIVVTIGILLHTGIAITMGLSVFSLFMMTFLVSYLPGDAFKPRFFSLAKKTVSLKFNPESEAQAKAVAMAIAVDTDGAVVATPDKSIPATTEISTREAWAQSSFARWAKWWVK